MKRCDGLLSPLVLVLLVVPVVAGAVIEPKTETEYPDQITVETGGGSASLEATGVGLREKTFMKVDVYTIVSYVSGEAELAGDLGEAVRTLDAPKRIQMDLRRGFSRDKLINSFKEVIEKNYEDTSAFDTDLEIFFAYFDRDAEDGDQLIFDYTPGVGLITTLNGEVQGTISSFAFTEALWTVWFGEKPANDGLKRALLAEL